LASALAGIGDYETAKTVAKKAARLLEEHLGEEHVASLSSIVFVNKIHLRKNNPRSAKKWLLDKVIQWDDPARHDDPEFNWVQFEALIGVSDAHRVHDETDESEGYLKRAESKISLLDISRAAEAEMQLAHRWTMLLVREGRMDEALPFAEQELEKAQKSYGPTDYRTTKAADVVAHIYQHKQRYDESIAIFENSLALALEAYGSQHPITLVRIMHLAIAKYQAGEFAAAESLFSEYQIVHAELDRHKGPHHHEILIMWADCLQEVGRHAKAKQLVRQCCEFAHWGGKTEQSKRCDVIRARLSDFFEISRKKKIEGLEA
jgi:tetratricopeptide (TPR) repeat protein